MTAFDKFEKFGQKIYNGQDILKNHILNKYPVHLTDNTDDYEQVKSYDSDFVWLVDKNIETLRSFPWWFKPEIDQQDSIHLFPYVYKNSKRIKSWHKVKLVPTKNIQEKFVNHKHICGVYDVYNGYDNFDLFFLGTENDQTWKSLKDRFPHIECVESHSQAKEKSKTDMFWLVPNDVVVSEFFKFSYQPDDWSQDFTHVFGNGKSEIRDGVALFPKHYTPTEKELTHRYYVNKKELKIIASKPLAYARYSFENYEEYQTALKDSPTDLFWNIPSDVELTNEEIFETYFEHQNQYDRNINHVWLNGDHYDGVVLFSKRSPVTEKEFSHRFYANKKEHEVVASCPKKYDLFTVNNYADYKQALEHSTTEMFWGVPSDVNVDKNFKFDLYFSHHNIYDRNITHVFKNDKTHDGVVLFSKNVKLSEREVTFRFYSQKKEWDVVASLPKPYDIFDVDSYKDYLDAIENSSTDLFWASSKNIKIIDLSLLDNFYISHHDIVDRKQNHVFFHSANDALHRNGLMLLSKHKAITKREIDHRFPVERKEWDLVLSGPIEYDQFKVETYSDYLHALENSKTELFWATTNNIDWKIPNIYFTHDNEYDRKNNHAFEHRVDDKILFNGLFLLSKHKVVSQKEIEYRHIIDVKEWQIFGSQKTSYEIFEIDSYDEYVDALETSRTELFWAVSRNINCDNFDFDLYFTHNNEYDRKTNHSFIHLVNDEVYRNGVFLFSKHSPVTQREIEHRFVANAKEWDIVASNPIEYEIWDVDNYQEYLEAMASCQTELFWATSRNINTDAFDFASVYFTHDNTYDRKINHCFAHLVGGEKYYNGLMLVSKHSPLTEKEIEHRFPIHKKEWDVVASVPVQYDYYEIDSYQEYVQALEDVGTEMFWMSSRNIKLDSAFDLASIYFTHDNEFDRKINHSFIHRVNGKDYRNGLFLCSKHTPLSEKEVEYRHLINSKEWSTVASGPIAYEVFTIDDYDDYLKALKTSSTEMFWGVSKNLSYNLPDLYFTHDDEYDRKTNHNFLHIKGKRNGVFLFSTHAPVTPKEIQNRFIVNAKEWDIVVSDAIEYDKFIIETYDDYLHALDNTKTEMFWALSRNVDYSDFDFNLYFTHDDTFNRTINHAFLHCENKFNGIFLLTIHSTLTKKEIEHRHLIERKEWTDRSTGPKKYDVFEIDSYDEYLAALENSTTELFWMSSRNIIADIPDLYFTHDNEYDRKINHNFLHCGKRNGLFLISKHKPVTAKEIEHRHIVNAKEWDIEASRSKPYDVFEIDSYDEYLAALENTTTEMFWMSSRNVIARLPDLYFTHDNEYDRKTNHSFLHCGKRNGVFLCSIHKLLTAKEVEHRHIINSKEWDIEASNPKPYDVFEIDSYDEYLAALENTTTEMFWMSSRNITPQLPDLYFTHDNEYDRKTNHSFLHCGKRNGVFLCSIHNPLTSKEVEFRHVVNAKEWNVEASTSKSYDVFVVDSYNDYLNALENTTTEMFWGVSNNLTYNLPNLYFTHDNEYDRKINHNFLHCGKLRNGVFLFSKHKPVTAKEIEHRFLINAKEWNVEVSGPVVYNKFTIDTYNDYLHALETSKTEMFWGIPSDINVNYNFKLYFTHDNEYDRKTNHVMLNGEHRDGIVLFSKHSPVTQKEVENRFYIKKKDWDIVASTPKPYEFYNIVNYNDYLEALENSPTELFWASTPNIKLDKEFDINLYFSHHNSYDRSINHAFVHRANSEDHYNGLFLLSKRAPLTQKEIEHRLIAKRKEWGIVASGPVEYEIFVVDTYEDYEIALNSSETEMFWMIPPEVNVDPNFKFDFYFTHNQWFERETNHVFKNGDAWDGISLVSKKSLITEREIRMRFLANKKQYNVVASTPKLYDIVFISKDEEHADINYSKLLERFPRAKRVHGVTGIHQAHIEAAKLCDSEMFWVVDADAEIIDKFNFDYYVPAYDPDGRKTVHVWKAQNPINNLVYGYGAVKLLPRELTLNMDTTKPDMTTSISPYFKSINRISNITKFNTDEFSTWRSAFRECVKLASRSIDGQLDEETEFRLKIWCTRGKDKPFGEYCIAGALEGKAYGETFKGDLQALAKINDFEWLYSRFKLSNQSI